MKSKHTNQIRKQKLLKAVIPKLYKCTADLGNFRAYSFGLAFGKTSAIYQSKIKRHCLLKSTIVISNPLDATLWTLALSLCLSVFVCHESVFS